MNTIPTDKENPVDNYYVNVKAAFEQHDEIERIAQQVVFAVCRGERLLALDIALQCSEPLVLALCIADVFRAYHKGTNCLDGNGEDLAAFMMWLEARREVARAEWDAK
jgi:hypothetical protein